MVKVCDNTKVRLPTVNVYVDGSGVPNIIPNDDGSAELTSDGYNIANSPYILTFILDSELGYFSDFTATFTPMTGYDPSLIFIPCNIVTNPQGTGLPNYLMYLVRNAVSANGQTKAEIFSCTVSYQPWGSPKPELRAMNGGSIQNDPSN